ncbi:MAG TPA: lipoyl(octanoyl) transferase LipB [Vicinamibacterales bacterium]|jgi:lipoyl(octanoyl) transferase
MRRGSSGPAADPCDATADSTVASRPLDVRRIGAIPYKDALALQAGLVEERKQGSIADQLLLLEHPPVVTLGVRNRSDRSHVLESQESLASRGVELFEAGRGGDVTFHGPGQLVGYPILDLKPDRCDVHRYVRDLEEVLIRTAAEFDISAGRIPGLTGIWVRNEKLAAIGVRISRWVTSHGFAINVSTDLSGFELIVPCGIADKGVTSMRRLLGRPVPMRGVEDAVVRHFCEVFGARVTAEPSQGAQRPS